MSRCLDQTAELNDKPIQFWFGCQSNNTMDPDFDFLSIARAFDAKSCESRATALATFELIGTHDNQRDDTDSLQA